MNYLHLTVVHPNMVYLSGQPLTNMQMTNDN